MSITVEVYNRTGVKPQILNAAEGEAARIFRQAGFEVAWPNCSAATSKTEKRPTCADPFSATRFAVRIVSNAPRCYPKTLLGVSFPFSNGGTLMTVFYDRENELANKRIASHAQILGHAIAHELGHLLLGPTFRNGLGIMREPWTTEELERLAKGTLLFTADESILMQCQLKRREKTWTINTTQGGISCDLPTTPARFTLRLLSKEMTHRLRLDDEIYGFAHVTADGTFGTVANVFADRARELAADEESRRVLLGHFIGHELGHLLLGDGRHAARAGIMHVPSRTDQVEQAKRGALLFLEGPARTIRGRVIAPMMSGESAAVEPTLKFTVFVYNYAAVPPEVMIETKAEATRIYVQTGIGIQWLDCPLSPQEADRFPGCDVRPGPTTLALRVLSRSMAGLLRRADDTFGFAMFPEDGSFATIANVFPYDAEDLANRHGLQHGVILGHLAAHELGHLLLGAGNHSSTGIMHVPWRLKELKGIRQKRMIFTPDQAERMRFNLKLRLGPTVRREKPN